MYYKIQLNGELFLHNMVNDYIIITISEYSYCYNNLYCTFRKNCNFIKNNKCKSFEEIPEELRILVEEKLIGLL